MRALLLVILLVLAIDIPLAFVTAGRLGPGLGLTWLLGSALLGAWSLRQAPRRLTRKTTQGEAPAQLVFEWLVGLMAGLGLLLPGVLTDGVGVLLLLPFLRRAAARGLTRFVSVRAPGPGATGEPGRAPFSWRWSWSSGSPPNPPPGGDHREVPREADGAVPGASTASELEGDRATVRDADFEILEPDAE